VTEEELKHERPAEYDALVASGRLETLSVPPEPSWVSTAGAVIGTIAVATGLALLAFIIQGALFG
jgi:hypothetical protein